MYLKQIALVNFCWLSFCLGVRVYFSKCNFNGFSCVSLNQKLAVTYTCPSSVNDVTIYINQFGAPTTIQSLTINNCSTLTLSVRCTNENRPMDYLKVTNIHHLKFQRLQYQSQLAASVIFENISYIETIPSFTFTQVDRNLHTAGCILPKKDFENLFFRNLTIDTVQSNAFVALTNFKNFTFDKVKINRMQSSSLNVKLDKSGLFFVQSSEIEIIEHLAFQISAKKVFFTQNSFVDIATSGINGTLETFYFVNNTVNTLRSHGLSLLVTSAYILTNRFEYLKAGAFEGISPGLMQDSGRNFGTLKFVYDFSRNYVNFMDAGCLNPDIVAYENVATEMLFNKNQFFCSCENTGWLVSDTGHGYNTAAIQVFYEMVLDEEFGNVCSYSCDLSIKNVKRMIRSGRCIPNVTVNYLCVNQDVTTKKAPERMYGISTEIPQELNAPEPHSSADPQSITIPSVFCAVLFAVYNFY